MIDSQVKAFLDFLKYIAEAEPEYPFVRTISEIAHANFGDGNVSRSKVDDLTVMLKNIKSDFFSKQDKTGVELVKEIEDMLWERVERGYFRKASSSTPRPTYSEVEDDFGRIDPYENPEVYDALDEYYGYGTKSSSMSNFNDYGNPSIEASPEEQEQAFWDRYDKLAMKTNKNKKPSYYNSNYWDIPDLEDKDYFVIGYGSLINERSRSRTVKTLIDDCPVKVKGWKRVFNVGLSKGTVLNVIEDKSSWINASLMQVTKLDLEDLIMREMLYEMKMIPASDLEFAYGKTLEIPEGESVVIFVSDMNTQQYPKRNYLHTCLYGALQYGKQFLKDFVETTYTHDGKPLKGYISGSVGKQNLAKMLKSDGDY